MPGTSTIECKSFFKYILNSSHSPFGHLDDIFYRIEFQHRGSPHVHGITWIRDALKFDINSDEGVCAYFDRIIVCTSNVLETEQEYIEFQKHHHSQTCYKKIKGKKVCRFGAPWPPMRHTVILRPLDADNEPEMLKEYKNLHNQMQEILAKMKPEDSNIIFENFLSKLGITEEVYILAIHSSLQKPKVF